MDKIEDLNKQDLTKTRRNVKLRFFSEEPAPSTHLIIIIGLSAIGITLLYGDIVAKIGSVVFFIIVTYYLVNLIYDLYRENNKEVRR